MKSGAGKFVPEYGREVAVARNGQHMLRAMHDGVKRGMEGIPPSPSVTAAATNAAMPRDNEMDDFGKMLSWLPAFDRRDALVVWSVLRAPSR